MKINPWDWDEIEVYQVASADLNEIVVVRFIF